MQRTSSTNHLHGSRACRASRVISVFIQRFTLLLSWFYAYALKQHALLKKNQQILALSCIVNSQIHVCTCIHETHKWNTILDLQNLNDFIVSTVKNKFTQSKYNYATSVPLMNVRALIINTCKLNQICGSTSSSQFSKMRHQNLHGNVHVESFIILAQWIVPQIFKLLPKRHIFFDLVIRFITNRKYAFFCIF